MAVASLLLAACTPTAEKATDSGLLQSRFQTEVNGKKTDLFTLRNKNNMEVCITNFGGRIVSVMVPDKDGQMSDVVLGFDSIQNNISKPSDFGASIGRYANRINLGKFTLGGVARKCASLKSPKTGIVLDVYTDEPGIQMYAGNFLDGSLTGKKGITYNQRASICLETQKYPDTPNKPEWPSAVLRPGDKYTSQCIFKFSVNK